MILLPDAIRLNDVTLLIVDECHRAVGNYAYVFLAQRYLATADKPRILAMTASPGGIQEKVQEVCTNLGIAHVENRTENDPDVRPYVFEREIEYISIELPPELKSAITVINALIDERLALLVSLHFTVPRREKLSMKALNEINAQIQQRIANRDPAAYSAASLYAACMKLRHAITLAESQGSEVLKGYLAKLCGRRHRFWRQQGKPGPGERSIVPRTVRTITYLATGTSPKTCYYPGSGA